MLGTGVPNVGTCWPVFDACVCVCVVPVGLQCALCVYICVCMCVCLCLCSLMHLAVYKYNLCLAGWRYLLLLCYLLSVHTQIVTSVLQSTDRCTPVLSYCDIIT